MSYHRRMKVGAECSSQTGLAFRLGVSEDSGSSHTLTWVFSSLSTFRRDDMAWNKSQTLLGCSAKPNLSTVLKSHRRYQRRNQSATGKFSRCVCFSHPEGVYMTVRMSVWCHRSPRRSCDKFQLTPGYISCDGAFDCAALTWYHMRCLNQPQKTAGTLLPRDFNVRWRCAEFLTDMHGFKPNIKLALRSTS